MIWWKCISTNSNAMICSTLKLIASWSYCTQKPTWSIWKERRRPILKNWIFNSFQITCKKSKNWLKTIFSSMTRTFFKQSLKSIPVRNKFSEKNPSKICSMPIFTSKLYFKALLFYHIFRKMKKLYKKQKNVTTLSNSFSKHIVKSLISSWWLAQKIWKTSPLPR